MSTVVIRPLGAEDPGWMADAFAALGWRKPREQFERYLAEQRAGERPVWVAVAGDALAGYVTLNWRPEYAPFRAAGIPEIQDLNVLPAFRRRGIGGRLLDVAEAAAAERVGTVGIAVGLAPDYGSAQRLYVRRGYVPDGRGITRRSRTVAFGEQVRVDDDLALCFTRELAR